MGLFHIIIGKQNSMIYIDCGNGNENDFDVELAEKLQDMLTEEQSKEI